MGKSRFVFTPSGHFARLYQFLVREPPSLPVFDTKLVGSYFTPSGQKAPVVRGFPGDFAELYGSDNASLYRRSGADCKSGCLRWFILPHLSISPNCVDTIWRNVFSRNRFRISPNRLPLCLLPDLHAVPEDEDHAAVSVYGCPFHQRVPKLGREIGDGRFGEFQPKWRKSNGI